jgi:hypothetical protein
LVPDLDSHSVDGFDIDENWDDADDWDEQVVELSRKGSSTYSKVMAIEVKSLVVVPKNTHTISFTETDSGVE